MDFFMSKIIGGSHLKYQIFKDRWAGKTGVALYELIFPQVWEKFFPGDGQDVVGTGAYRILADKDEIIKYTFFFQISVYISIEW